MLVMSLAATVGMLCLVVHQSRGRVTAEACVTSWFGLLLGVGCLLGYYPTYLVAQLLVALTATACAIAGVPPRRFATAAVALTAAVYAVSTWLVVKDIEDARRASPVLSLGDRVPGGRVPDAAPPAEPGNLDTLELLVQYGTEGRDFFRDKRRRGHLVAFHERWLEVFVTSPRFGVMRMPAAWESLGYPAPGPVPQPEPPSRRPSPPEADSAVPDIGPRPDALWWGSTHLTHVADFVQSDGEYYVRDRDHVIGFLPHAFRELPNSSEWQIAAIDLVSLLKHPEPVAYVSDHLPRMEELKDAPTWPLDGFEAAALARVKKGEDVVTAAVPDGVRMLGAVRAGKQCLACHEGERGDLLGAFSYRLRPTR